MSAARCLPTLALALSIGVLWPTVPSTAQQSDTGGQKSIAEQIAQLRRSIRDDEALLARLQQQLQDPDSSYHKASRLFQQLDEQRAELQRQLEAAQEAGDRDHAAKLRAQLEKLQKQWQLAKDSFDAEIRNRKLLQERIANLKKKIAADRAALAKLTGEALPEQEGVRKTSPAASDDAAAQRAEPSSSQAAEPDETVGEPQQQGAAEQQGDASGEAAASPTLGTTEQVAAQLAETVDELRARVNDLKQQLKLVRSRLAVTRRTLRQEEQALKVARTSHRTALDTLIALQAELRKRIGERAGETDPARLQQLDRQLQQLSAAEAKVKEASEAIGEQENRIQQLRDVVAQLEQQEVALQQELEEAQARLREQELKAYWFTKLVQLVGLKDWLWEHGPRILGILIGALLLWWLVRVAERRMTAVILRASRGEEEDEEERLNRARTLTGFFRHAAGLIILGGTVALILAELGVNLRLMLGGAAITGLAAAFAAQNLLRDYFSGFVILLENQYGINDVVKIGDIAGIVEKVTLRLTILRGLDGTVHFVPNGQIATVSNMTHGWSRALFDIEVSYNEDLDRVMAVLMDLARELRDDPVYGPLILDDPEMLGVDEFRASGISIKFYIKTKPLRQWAVKRELNRRIKRRFDELGIEIPFPHRTVYHRFEEADPALRLLAQALGVSAAGASADAAEGDRAGDTSASCLDDAGPQGAG